MRRTEEFTMHSGRSQDNAYANATDFRAQRIENITKSKEPPAAKKAQGWVIIALVVVLILTSLMLVIFPSLLFMFYNSVTEQQSHLKNNVKELNSQLEQNEQETYKNFTSVISRLRNNVKELTSQLEKHKADTNSGLQKNVSALQELVANIKEDLREIKKKEKINGASCTSCPVGWRLVTSNCYYFQENRETWEKSQVECAKFNSVLLILKNKAELDSLLPVIGQRRFWLGLRRDSTDLSRWLWTDRSRLTISAWAAGEPNNDHDDEHCAEILGGVKAMNDRDCDDKIGYICKRLWTC